MTSQNNNDIRTHIRDTLIASVIGGLVQIVVGYIGTINLFGSFLVYVIDFSEYAFLLLLVCIGLPIGLMSVRLFQKSPLSRRNMLLYALFILIFMVWVHFQIMKHSWWCNGVFISFSITEPKDIEANNDTWIVYAPRDKTLLINFDSKIKTDALRCSFKKTGSGSFNQLKDGECDLSYRIGNNDGLIEVTTRELGCKPIYKKSLFFKPLGR